MGGITMLVTFSCPAYADITMFGDVAVHLLKMMGHSGKVPSALLAADVPAALERLEAAGSRPREIRRRLTADTGRQLQTGCLRHCHGRGSAVGSANP
jgi:hypothetical protein